MPGLKNARSFGNLISLLSPSKVDLTADDDYAGSPGFERTLSTPPSSMTDASSCKTKVKKGRPPNICVRHARSMSNKLHRLSPTKRHHHDPASPPLTPLLPPAFDTRDWSDEKTTSPSLKHARSSGTFMSRLNSPWTPQRGSFTVALDHTPASLTINVPRPRTPVFLSPRGLRYDYVMTDEVITASCDELRELENREYSPATQAQLKALIECLSEFSSIDDMEVYAEKQAEILRREESLENSLEWEFRQTEKRIEELMMSLQEMRIWTLLHRYREFLVNGFGLQTRELFRARKVLKNTAQESAWNDILKHLALEKQAAKEWKAVCSNLETVQDIEPARPATPYHVLVHEIALRCGVPDETILDQVNEYQRRNGMASLGRLSISCSGDGDRKVTEESPQVIAKQILRDEELLKAWPLPPRYIDLAPGIQQAIGALERTAFDYLGSSEDSASDETPWAYLLSDDWSEVVAERERNGFGKSLRSSKSMVDLGTKSRRVSTASVALKGASEHCKPRVGGDNLTKAAMSTMWKRAGRVYNHVIFHKKKKRVLELWTSVEAIRDEHEDNVKRAAITQVALRDALGNLTYEIREFEKLERGLDGPDV